ncbi:MAG: disulfide isomerase DsbC N-terminal domain-containing protein [Candidatus Sulfobium sp.]|jgi:thiol:disulfide interchange protein DsbC
MKKLFFVISILSVFLLSGNAFAFGGCEADCKKCHSLEMSEVRHILTKLHASDAKVLGIKMSPIKGLWQVTVDEQGKKGVLYVSFSKKYVVGGSIFEVDTASNKTAQTLQSAQPARYVDVSRIPVDNALVMGNSKARYRVVVFTDPD